METCRWPNASYSVSSMSCGLRPSREVVLRSKTTNDWSPLSCWSLFTSAISLSVRNWRSTRGAHVFSSTRSTPWSARHLGQLRAQACDHLVDTDLSVTERFQRDEHATGIRVAAAAPAEPRD